MNERHLELLASDDWRQVLREHAIPFAFDDLTPADLGVDVLEIGPGPGLTTDLVHPQVEHLTALELDAALAELLANRLSETNVVVVEGDATSMPFEDGRFTGAFSLTMLHHVPTVEQQDAVFAEVCRVLRPSGLFVASDSVAGDELAALHDDDIYNPVDPSTLVTRLEVAGFGDVDVRSNPFAWAVHPRRPRG